MTYQTDLASSVPPIFTPLIFGSGRLASHLCHALATHQLPFLAYTNTRTFSDNENFWEQYSKASHFWCLTSDQVIGKIFQTTRQSQIQIPFLHSSAATSIEGASTLHPMMTFSTRLFEPEFYSKMTWVRFDNEPIVSLPTCLFRNTVVIPQNQRELYHASCVMASNFTQLLLNAATTTIPILSRNDYSLLIRTAVENYLSQGIDALTGPLKRQDKVTIEKHLQALLLSPQLKSARLHLYQSFVDYYGESNL